MNKLFVDSLEHRLFLSNSGDDFELAVDPGITQEGVMMTLTAPSKAASTVKKGYYSGKGTLDGISGNLILQITTVKSNTFSGKFKTADWGAFDLQVTGTINNGAVLFSGKNSVSNVKSFKGRINGNTLDGALSIVQNKANLSGKFTGKYATTSPSMANVVEPNVKGQYALTSNEDHKTLKMDINRQEDGKIWGTIGGSPSSGVIMTGGKFEIRMNENDGYSMLIGTLKTSTGKITGSWHWYGEDGDNESGTFYGSRK